MQLSSNPSSPVSISQRRWPELRAIVELLKPVTWFPPMWAFVCGAISSGIALTGNLWPLVGGIILAGPLVCAMSQAINDWHDRHVDAINEPERPIPSGRVPGRWGLYVAVIWSVLALMTASFFGVIVFAATVVGLILAWAYSAPPFRFKLNGWIGNGVVAICYEGLAWFTGAAILIGGMPGFEILVIAFLYSVGAHGIMTLNDFKSIAGDQRMGVRSLPVQLGAESAARMASVVMALPQFLVVGLLIYWGLPWHAAAVGLLLILQLWFMVKYLGDQELLMREPKRSAALYNVTGVTLYVSGMMITAFGLAALPGMPS